MLEAECVSNLTPVLLAEKDGLSLFSAQLSPPVHILVEPFIGTTDFHMEHHHDFHQF